MDYTSTEIFILAIGALGLGMYLLFKGGDWTIDGAVFVAKRFGISPLVIGFTIVAFGTSLPELLVSVNANLAGSPGIAIGNVIGSNIANILLVVGATAFVSTLVVKPRELFHDILVVLAASGLMAGLMIHGNITQSSGVLMIVALAVFVLWQYFRASKGEIAVEEIEEPKYKNLFQGFLVLLMGLIAIALGAEFLVRGAKVSATIIGVPEDVIGLSVIALGTSLPELSTCVIAALKKQSDLVIGNILGSNLFNILMIMGITSMVKPIEQSAIAPQVLSLDVWVMLGITVLFSGILLLFKKVNRPIGFMFLAGYIFYIVLIYALYLKDDVISLS